MAGNSLESAELELKADVDEPDEYHEADDDLNCKPRSSKTLRVSPKSYLAAPGQRCVRAS